MTHCPLNSVYQTGYGEARLQAVVDIQSLLASTWFASMHAAEGPYFIDLLGGLKVVSQMKFPVAKSRLASKFQTGRVVALCVRC